MNEEVTKKPQSFPKFMVKIILTSTLLFVVWMVTMNVCFIVFTS